MSPADATFELLGRLPAGRVVIEASAGTGKTHTLAVLATRYLAEERVVPSELLIVTFTRAATAELRTRIREQMVTCVTALGRDDRSGDDELSALLARRDRNGCLERLERALADFDSAVISTMHSFAAQVRSTLGITSAIDPDARLTADVSMLVKHACADALAAAAVEGIPEQELPKLTELVKATELALSIPDVVLEPTPDTPGATDAQRRLRSLVIRSIGNAAARRSDDGTLGFDDVLTQLRNALLSPSAQPVIAALQRRFKVVLIDEFQDTDRVQWEIFSTLFDTRTSGGALVLVGDPKQAIYRFRGADIDVYLDAVDPASGVERYSLGTNWRSDDAVLRSLRRFFTGATFGSPSIGYVDVGVAPANDGRRLATGDGSPFPSLDVRVAVGPGLPRKGALPDTVKTARLVERDMVAHIRTILTDGWIPSDKEGVATRKVAPSDIAVLVTSAAQARSAQSALRRCGVPAVIAGAGSVLSSWAADQIRVLLHAMENPSDLRRVRAHALSWFADWDPARVASAEDGELRELQDALSSWSTRLGDHPVAEVLAHIWQQTGVVQHLLARYDGDRHVTDLDHLAELLHAGSPDGTSGVAGLRGLLDAPPESDGDPEVDTDLVARRIESEDQAVQIMTIWKAKGLEFPVVCLPMLWRPPKVPESVVYTDPVSRARSMDVAKGTVWPDKRAAAERKELARAEEAGERLRLLYVAMTRARHHTAIWWADSKGSDRRSISCFLFARDPATGLLRPDELAAGTCTIPGDDDVVSSLREGLASDSEESIRISAVAVGASSDGPTPPAGSEPDIGQLGIEAFTATLSRSVHRWSFSSITHRAVESGTDPFDDTAGDGGASDESDRDESDDDTAGAMPEGALRRPQDGTPAPAPAHDAAPLHALRAGTSFGTFVHGVLEQVDFAAADLFAEVTAAATSEASRAGVDLDTLAPESDDGAQLLVDGLVAAVRTPLGPLFDDRQLADIDRRDRMDELAFDLRFAEGSPCPTTQDIGRLASALLSPDHPLQRWAADLAAGSIEVRLAGYLTGSIDLVVRLSGEDGGRRYVVADYKTNQLVRRGEAVGRDSYGPRALADAMVAHHYPLQALLYAVALHRYLRWKDPCGPGETRVAGASYLFVRGMTGASVRRTDAQPHGVFSWDIPPALVIGLSDLIAGIRPEQVG